MNTERPRQEVTPVATTSSPISWFSPNWLAGPVGWQIHNSLFPGNTPGGIRYEYLISKYAGRLDEVPQRHQVIGSKVGSKVGLHVYQGKGEARLVVILCHGNTRSVRFLPELVQMFIDCCGVTVVGRDFVGYDMSSSVPNGNGALEVASMANDAAVVEWVADQYPRADLVVCGRSIGTFGWANMLTHQRVVGALGIVPFTSAEVVIRNLIGSLPWPVSGLASWGQQLAHAAFPSGCASVDGDIISRGFSLGEFSQSIAGKQVVLFPASRDDLVPESEAEALKVMLERAGARVQVQRLEGGHDTLPSQKALRSALELLGLDVMPDS